MQRATRKPLKSASQDLHLTRCILFPNENLIQP